MSIHEKLNIIKQNKPLHSYQKVIDNNNDDDNLTSKKGVDYTHQFFMYLNTDKDVAVLRLYMRYLFLQKILD